MKKLLAIASLGVVTCASVMAAIDWNSGSIDNLAKGSTVTASSNSAEASLIVDDNNGTGWQANAATHEYTHDWVMIDFGAETTFTDIEIVWEASHCKSYSIYLSKEAIPYTTDETTGGISYNQIDASWLEGTTPIATRTNDTEANYTDAISFDDAQTGQYLLVYADEYNNFGAQYGMRIFDIRVADIQGRDEIASLRLTQQGNAVAGGDAVEVTVCPVNKIGDVMEFNTVSDVTLTCDNQAVTIEGGDNGVYSVKSSEYGTFTLSASAMADGTAVMGSLDLVVSYNWEGVENVAVNKAIQGRVIADVEDANPPSNAVDGSLDNYYQFNGEWAGGDSWLLVDLGDIYMVDAIGAYYTGNGATNGRCVFGYAVDATSIEQKIAEEGTNFVWRALPQDADWTFSPELARTNDVITTYTYATPVVARYIVVKDADNPSGKPCVNEIYVAGKVREAAKPAAINLSLEKDGIVIGETTTISASVIDQYGKPFDATPEITVTGAKYADGVITGEKKGMVTVTATAGDITKEVKFYVADENDYCLTGAVVTASEGAPEDTAPVTDGGKVITNYGLPYQLSINEDAGSHEHWIMTNLAKPYDIDLIAVIWEGACPADYDVFLGETEESMVLYYSQRDKEGPKDYSDRFSGKEMNGIQYIKVVTTRNATGYGPKLYDLKAYGTSDVASVADKIEVTVSDNDIVTEDVVTLSAVVYDQFGAEMSDQEVTYSCNNAAATIEGNTFKASLVGTYTVTAVCGGVSADIEISVVADAENKMRADQLANTTTLNDEPLSNNIFANQEISISDIPSTLVIDFEMPHDFTLLSIRWEAACPSDYTVEATYADGSSAIVFSVSDRKFVGGMNPVDKIINDAVSAQEMDAVGHADLNKVAKLTFHITGKDHVYPIRLLGIDAYGTTPASSAVDIFSDIEGNVDVYDINGVKVRANVEAANALEGLPRGIYIVGGRKIIR